MKLQMTSLVLPRTEQYMVSDGPFSPIMPRGSIQGLELKQLFLFLPCFVFSLNLQGFFFIIIVLNPDLDLSSLISMQT